MKGTLLYLVSLILLFIFYPIGYIWSLIIVKWAKLGRYNENVAIGIDVLGNIFLAPVLNKYFVTNKGYQFGYRGETISSVLGKNKIVNMLSALGKTLANLLDKIDKNHCINSIDKRRNW